MEPFSTYLHAIEKILPHANEPSEKKHISWILLCAKIHFSIERSLGLLENKEDSTIDELIELIAEIQALINRAIESI